MNCVVVGAMSKNGIGVGSASLTLIFVVLCMAVFALISHTSAENEMILAEAEAAMVKGYYEADALATIISVELASVETIPESLYGVDITAIFDEDISARIAGFSLSMSQTRELHVIIALDGNDYEILTWRIRDAGSWIPDSNLPVWRGQAAMHNS